MHTYIHEKDMGFLVGGRWKRVYIHDMTGLEKGLVVTPVKRHIGKKSIKSDLKNCILAALAWIHHP
jgi:hypothetical protein